MSSVSIPERAIPSQPLCPQYVTEGDVITKYVAGEGCKLVHYDSIDLDVIVSTKIGAVSTQEIIADAESKDIDMEENTSSKDKDNNSNNGNDEGDNVKLVTVSVGEDKNSKSNLLPQECDIVICRVTRISLQRANVEIIGFQNDPLPIDGGIGTNGTTQIGINGGSGGLTFSMSQNSSDLGETYKGIIRSQDVRSTDRDRVKMIECFKPGDIVKAKVLSLGDGVNYYLTTANNDLGVIFAKSNNGAGSMMYATDWQHMVSPLTGVVEKRKCAKPF